MKPKLKSRGRITTLLVFGMVGVLAIAPWMDEDWCYKGLINTSKIEESSNIETKMSLFGRIVQVKPYTIGTLVSVEDPKTPSLKVFGIENDTEFIYFVQRVGANKTGVIYHFLSSVSDYTDVEEGTKIRAKGHIMSVELNGDYIKVMELVTIDTNVEKDDSWTAYMSVFT